MNIRMIFQRMDNGDIVFIDWSSRYLQIPLMSACALEFKACGLTWRNSCTSLHLCSFTIGAELEESMETKVYCQMLTGAIRSRSARRNVGKGMCRLQAAYTGHKAEAAVSITDRRSDWTAATFPTSASGTIPVSQVPSPSPSAHALGLQEEVRCLVHSVPQPHWPR